MSEQKTSISVVHGYEPCEECGAPLDPQQRYCVNCAARRGNGANPSSRYFALLPIAVALGVVAGRSDGGGEDNEALLQALRNSEAQTASTAATGTAAGATAKAKAKKDGKGKKAGKQDGGKVVAQTKNGEVHSVTSFEASDDKVEEDTQIVAENPEQTGDNYIKAQQNLPDVVVIGGDPGSAPAPSSGVEP
jgi:hypothetical protein